MHFSRSFFALLAFAERQPLSVWESNTVSFRQTVSPTCKTMARSIFGIWRLGVTHMYVSASRSRALKGSYRSLR
jgi:hypothetical protein